MLIRNFAINYTVKKFPARKWWLVLLYLIFSSSFLIVKAQRPTIKFTHITNLDGLSQSTVQAIVKDKDGFMWFGTQDGLNRYDGYTFKVYRHNSKDSSSLSRNNIMSLYVDRQGNLWVGAANGALCLYDRNHDNFIHFKESEGNYQGMSQKSVTEMYEDRQNNFWVGTYWKLNLLDRKTGKITQFGNDALDSSSISNDGITSIFEDTKNNLWVGTVAGLNLMDRKTKKFTHYFHENQNPNSLTDNKITVIKEDNRGRLWIGTDKGLNLFDPITNSFTHFVHDPNNRASITDNHIVAIEDQGDGKLWIGTTSGLDLFDADKGVFTHLTSNPYKPTSLNRNANITSMLYDREKILWVGTYQGGINKYDKQLTYFDTYRNNPFDLSSISSNTVTSFAENPDGNIWVGTDGGALNLWKKTSNTFVRFNPDPDNKKSLGSWGIICLYQSKINDYLWIGTYGACIDRYNPKTNTFKHFSKGNDPHQLNNDAVFAIFEDNQGNIWIGTNGGGVNVLNPGTGIITKYLTDPNNANTVAGDYIRSFYQDKKGNIWIGTTTGISEFDPRTNNFTQYNETNTDLESDVIFSLNEDAKGNMWIGTLGGGLSVLDPQTRKVINYTTTDGLPDNTINCILKDKEYLWISTGNGISRFDPVKKTFKNYGISNGIQSFEFSQHAGLKTSRGEILFGGINGFNVFNPDNLTENKNIPPVVFTGFKLFNNLVTSSDTASPLKQDITQTREITLSYDQSIITFEFAALGFTASNKNRYAYKLEGFDKKWNFTYQRRVTYTNLDPGKYTLRIRASNDDGLWNNEGASLILIITPPFWATWWFKTLAIIIILAGTVAFFRYRINAVNKQKIQLQQQVDEQTAQLRTAALEEKKARKEAENANIALKRKNKEIEEFAYIASHDLQEPLRTTSGFVALLHKRYKGKLDEKAETYFTFITDASNRMKLLIKNLLDYSRIGNREEPELVDCDAILRNLLADLSMAIGEAKAEIKADPLPVVFGYPTELKQLFQNLITNAIKFRKKDVLPEIHISVIEGGEHFQFAFSDNGIGIEDAYFEKIFAIFQRLHTQSEYEGSGIGLSYCKKIIELHKGQIWVESKPGQGSTFYFTIPSKT
jgi:ligand-binding sensor domain-containing protein/signal transduction histidine kinase